MVFLSLKKKDAWIFVDSTGFLKSYCKTNHVNVNKTWYDTWHRADDKKNHRLKECPWPNSTLLKIPTFSSSFFFSSLNWLILCFRNWLSCKTSFSVDASFCSSSSCWEWDVDWSENGVWMEVFSYCGYSERKKT